MQAERDQLYKQVEQLKVDYEQKLSAAAAENLVALDRLRIELANEASAHIRTMFSMHVRAKEYPFLHYLKS